MKHRIHKYESDSDFNDFDDDYNPLNDYSLDQNGMPILQHTLSNNYFQHSHSNNNNKNTFADEVSSASEEEEDEPDYDDLLEIPLSPEERTQHTAKGLKVIVEWKRAQHKYPWVTVNITDWDSILSIVAAFNTVLKRFGTIYCDYLVELHWEKQKRPYAIDWKDLNSLHIPFNRKPFYIELSKIPNSRKRKAGAALGEAPCQPTPKRAKVSKSKQKQMVRQKALDIVKTNMDAKYRDYINGLSNSQSMWYRMAHLYSREQWSLQKIQHMIENRYLKKKTQETIEAAQQPLSTTEQPTAAQVRSISKTISTTTSTAPATSSTEIKRIAQDTTYFKNIMKEDISSMNQSQNHNVKMENTSPDESFSLQLVMDQLKQQQQIIQQLQQQIAAGQGKQENKDINMRNN